jgi:rhodanese-related sulfurtransferase
LVLLDFSGCEFILSAMKTLGDAILILIIGALIGAAVNTIRNSTPAKGLAWDTPWPDNRQKRELELPPSYQPGDSLLSLEDAYSFYLRGNAIFIDARESNEYEEGHIKGAINLPFEQWDTYWEAVRPTLDPKKEIVAYCGGLDCELSLFMARELKQLGFEHSFIFFGGWQKWNDASLPIEKSEGSHGISQ